MTIAENEMLQEFLHTDIYKTVMGAMEQFVSITEMQLMRFNLADGSKEKELIYSKCRAEGARKLFTDLSLYLEKLRVASLSPKENGDKKMRNRKIAVNRLTA